MRGGHSAREGSDLRNVALGEVLSGIDHMEVNWDCIVGKVAGNPRRTIGFGEDIREPALPRVDVFGGGLVTTLTTSVLGGAGNGDRDKREEDSKSDGEAKNHVRWKMTNEDDRNESGPNVITRDI